MQRGGKEKSGPWDDDPLIVAQTVHEKEKDRFSGLYDANGRPLYREETKVGFDLNAKINAR